MCGICGKVNFDRHQPVPRHLVRAMMDRIAHRGPDGAGDYYAGPVGLGHRRLSIIDLHTGTQPMGNEDGSIQVVFNGEIYNFRALRLELEQRGHRFASTTDTEVIVHLYEEMGDACVTRLEGMFAFALWDDRRKRLLVARDRVGIKPLYFADTGKSLVFASEIKALLVDPDIDDGLDPRAIDRFLTFYFVPGTATMHRGIAKLDPGHYLTVQDGTVEIRQYWDLRFERPDRRLSFADAASQLRELIARSVADHLISDVPVGVLLSGGVDSTAVLAHAATDPGRPLHTFTMGFDGAGFADERPFARMAAERYGTVHEEVTLSASEFQDFLPRYIWHMEEPICEPPAIALHFVARRARERGVKVLLSGEGGDEAFGGYPEYRNLIALEYLKSASGPFKPLLKKGFDALAGAGWARGRHYASLVDPAARDYYFSRTSTPASPFNRIRQALAASNLDGSGTRGLPDPMRDHRRAHGGLSPLAWMQYVDIKTWLPDDLLVKADKMTMAASVELRVPLLDARILEFAASLPDHYKVSGLRLKRVLKAAVAPSVPAAILARKKTGFPVPYAQWMRHEMRDFVHDTLLASDAFSRTFLPKRVVVDLLDADLQGSGCPKEVFSLLVLELWNRAFGRSIRPSRDSTQDAPARIAPGVRVPGDPVVAA